MYGMHVPSNNKNRTRLWPRTADPSTMHGINVAFSPEKVCHASDPAGNVFCRGISVYTNHARHHSTLKQAKKENVRAGPHTGKNCQFQG
ncbi:hypothetical protein BaRGS_00002687 [Batillaria attramentaria]|uniref:Uncharacterized protein n=1 Tax=Batillaria attramentaria TaxID=370345 RepID=A0ABD0M322_9CAEN